MYMNIKTNKEEREREREREMGDSRTERHQWEETEREQAFKFREGNQKLKF